MERMIKISKKILKYVFLYALILLTITFLWANVNFASINIENTLFTLSTPFIDKGGAEFLYSYMFYVVLPGSVIMLMIIAMQEFSRKYDFTYAIKFKNSDLQICPVNFKKRNYRIIMTTWVVGLLVLTNMNYFVTDFIKSVYYTSNIIEQEYVSPDKVKLTFPEKKRNLIYIFVESGESTLQDVQNGGMFDENYIPELTKIAKENVSFSHSDKVEGAAMTPAASWSIAGIFGQTSGLPLKLFEFDKGKSGTERNFMPGVISLGNILEKEGYNNYFMLGAESNFGGLSTYLKQHGNYEVFDYNTAKEKGKIAKDYFAFWGFEDGKLFNFAKEEIIKAAKLDKPFNYAMFTVNTHFKDGYLEKDAETKYKETYSNVWTHSSKQINEFVEWAKKQDFYKNTTIVIAGDHCSMQPDYFKETEYKKNTGEVERKIYNAIVNPAIKPKKEKFRKFVTLDMFPTTLGALGVQIEGNRLGIGTNLFSEKETLSEKYGYDKFFDELNKRSVFYDNEFKYTK